MKFWDTSALLPLLVEEETSKFRERQLSEDQEIAIWYGTPVEIESALSRREREGTLNSDVRKVAGKRLAALAGFWMEVNPTAQVRARALRTLRVHPLRAGDAFQLAAALVLTADNPGNLQFLTADKRLSEAAQKEGFLVEEC